MIICRHFFALLVFFFPCLGETPKSFSLLIVATFHAKYNGLSGIDSYASNHARILKEAGYKVCVAVQEGSGLHKRLLNEQVPCEPYNFTRALQGHDTELVGRFLKKIISQYQVTHIHCNWHNELSFVHKAIEKVNIPLFYTHHYQQAFPLQHYPFLAGVVLVNKLLVNGLRVRHQKLSKLPIVFIPPFLNEERFVAFIPAKVNPVRKAYGSERPIITMIGNMYNDIAYKNYPLLIKAVAVLKAKYNFLCTVLIVGGGPKKEMMQKLVATHGLSEDIHFLGFRSDIPTILDASDLVVLTSKVEGFGMVLAEANLMGRPVVGPAGTGVEGVIEDGVNGLLFKNDDVDDFCQKVIAVLADQQLKLLMGQQAKQYALKHFTNKQLLDQIQQLYSLGGKYELQNAKY